MMNELEIKLVNLEEPSLGPVRVMVCQFDIRNFKFEKDRDRLYRIEDNAELKQHIDRLLKVASINNVDMIVFPEFSIPESLIFKLSSFARNHNLYIIAGTHYFLKQDYFVSRCPVITPQRIHYVEKHDTSVLERTPIQTGRVLKSGDTNMIFQNSRFGSFAVTVCADFMDDKLKADLQIKNLSMLIVPAYHCISSDYHERMHINVKDSSQGLYVVYSNIKDGKSDSGKSGIFALVNREFLNDFREAECTDCIPETKIYQFKDTAEYAIFELDVHNRKPFIVKNNDTDFNVKLIAEDSLAKSNSSRLSQQLGVSGMHYQMLDSLYVEPNEFGNISRILDEKNVVLILGDPGTGKTYTAYRLMTEYFAQGYKPVWIHGYSKEDRITQQNIRLADYRTTGKEVIYLEDPFGHSTFDRREEILSFINPLIENIRHSNSKLIITSRSEVFNKFNEQHEVSILWSDIIDDINIAKPSYHCEQLVRIARNYIDGVKFLSPEIANLILANIQKGQMTSPLSIYDTILNLSENSGKKDTLDLMKLSVKQNLIDTLSEEYNQQSVPACLLYAMVLLVGNLNRIELSSIHKKVQERLFFKRLTILYQPFNSILNSALGYRLHTIGVQQPVLRFRHPSYEQAYCLNISNNSNNNVAFYELVDYLLENSERYFHTILVSLTRLRFIYIRIAELVALHICDHVPETLTVIQRVQLVRKMLTIKSETLLPRMLSILSPNTLLQHIYIDDKSDLNETLRLLRIYFDNGFINADDVNWKAIFTEQYLFTVPTNNLVDCLNTANCITPLVSTIVFDGVSKRVIYRMLLNAKEDNVLRRVCTLLKGTSNDSLIQEVEQYKLSYKRKRKLSVFNQFWLEKKLIINEVKGMIIVTPEALESIFSRYAPLYGVGIECVVGSFVPGDTILITDSSASKNVLAFTIESTETLLAYLKQPLRGSLKVTQARLCKRANIKKSEIDIIIKGLGFTYISQRPH